MEELSSKKSSMRLTNKWVNEKETAESIRKHKSLRSDDGEGYENVT